MSKSLALALGMLIVAMSLPAAADEAVATDDKAASAMLAEEFSGMSYKLLAGTEQVNPPLFMQSAALLDAACRLAPSESRYPRLLADNYLQIGDSANAMTALKAYCALVPDDQVAQTQLMDLFLARMQSADEKLTYCRSMADELADALRKAKAVERGGLEPVLP